MEGDELGPSSSWYITLNCLKICQNRISQNRISGISVSRISDRIVDEISEKLSDRTSVEMSECMSDKMQDICKIECQMKCQIEWPIGPENIGQIPSVYVQSNVRMSEDLPGTMPENMSE